MGRPSTAIEKKCEGCGTTYRVVPSLASRSRFCSAPCRNRAGADAVRKPNNVCPCGTEIPRPSVRLYCSSECRLILGKKKQADPANHVTFNCDTCESEVTRPRVYGGRRYDPGAKNFCSNECAAKWTRKVRHIGIKDSDVVLDSSYEAYVWGLCTIHKIPIQRVDRTEAVAFKDGWYAPDFIINGRYVEVKGYEDDDDRKRYTAWNAERPDRHLLVLRKEDLNDSLVPILSTLV